MNKILMVSFSLFVVLGSVKAFATNDDAATAALKKQVQIDLVKLQAIQQSQLNNLDTNVHAAMQSLQEQLQSLLQLQTQITTLHKELQTQINVVTAELDKQIKQLETTMSSQMKQVQVSIAK